MVNWFALEFLALMMEYCLEVAPKDTSCSVEEGINSVSFSFID